MIKKEKLYTEEFAKEVFEQALKNDLVEECRAFGFEPDLTDLNDILIAKFNYGGKECSITMDAINAEIAVRVGDKKEVDDFAGLTDHYLFAIGSDGIVAEADYAYVFCDMLNHLTHGVGPWVLQAIAIADDSDPDFAPIPYDKIEILNPATKIA